MSPGHPSNTAETTRAVSPVIGVVLLVAVTVVLAGTVVAFFLGADSGLRQPAPQVAQANADLDTQGSGVSGGIITVTHQGGDPVTVADIRIVVDTSDVADCSVDQAVIENLPSTAALGHSDTGMKISKTTITARLVRVQGVHSGRPARSTQTPAKRSVWATASSSD